MRKSYGTGYAHCNVGAQQLMKEIGSDFSAFANFSGHFNGGLAYGDVKFNPPSSATLQAHDSIAISLNVGVSLTPTGPASFAYSLDTSVTVTSVGSNTLSFETVPGHILYPASITFGAIDLGGGNINFAINVKGNLPGANSVLWKAGGDSFEDAQWNAMLS